MITFPVSDVPRTREPFRLNWLDTALETAPARRVEATACNVARHLQTPIHGFLSAVHNAFDSHRPLVLSPDDVWLCLVQGLATHVHMHAEELRDRFVRHQGKVQLRVRRDDFTRGSPGNDWPVVFSELSALIRAHIGKKKDLVVAQFSTTGAVEEAAFQLALFDGMQSYFDYDLRTMCGIPEITLLGEPSDWLSIRVRAELFAELDLTDWTSALRLVLDQIWRTSLGEIDRAFWQSFYKLSRQSGGPFVTGWINVLFPYLGWHRPHSDEPRKVEWNSLVTYWREAMNEDDPVGATHLDFPSGRSSAPFVWSYLGSEIPMRLTAGFVGVSHEAATGAVRPAIGWEVWEE